MTTREMVKKFKESVKITDHEYLNEVEQRTGFRNYKITVFIKIEPYQGSSHLSRKKQYPIGYRISYAK